MCFLLLPLAPFSLLFILLKLSYPSDLFLILWPFRPESLPLDVSLVKRPSLPLLPTLFLMSRHPWAGSSACTILRIQPQTLRTATSLIRVAQRSTLIVGIKRAHTVYFVPL
jgi:hypothetical protein